MAEDSDYTPNGHRECRKCGLLKSPDDFYKAANKAGLDSYCKECRKARGAAWYRANKDRHQASVVRWLKAHPEFVRAQKKANVQRNRDWVNQIKASTPCKDCDRRFPPWVMHFDHLDGSSKLHNVSKMAGQNRTKRLIREEIAKCEVVCAVCHAHRTYCRAHNIEHYLLGVGDESTRS